MKKLLSCLLVLSLCLSAVALALSEDIFRYDEPVTLTVSVFDRGLTGGTPVDNNYWTDWIQKEFGDPRNIQVKWSVIPRTEEVEKLNILMASGEAADICFTYTEAVITNFVKQGGLVELTDLIGEYGQGIQSYLGESLLSYGLFEGGQYAIPAKRVILATQGMFIREDWLDKLNIPMPTTKDELYDALVAFRDQKPGGDNVIPYAFNRDLTLHNHMMFSFIKDLTPKSLATIPDIMWEGYEDYILYLNKLYNEGLVSPDFALDDQDLHWGDISSGIGGAYTNNYDHPIRVSPGILSSLQAHEPEAKLSPLNCFESVTDPSKYYHMMYAPNGIFCFVPIYSQHPEAAIMYLDWLCRMDTLYFLQNGEEGVTHMLNEDGVPVLLDVDDEHKFNSMQNIDYTLLTNGQEFADPELRILAQALSYQSYADLFEPLYEISITDPVTTNFHFDVILEADSQFGTSLTQFRRELLTKSTMAAPEDCLDTFYALREQYMADGGQAVMEEKTVAWENMYGE